MTDHGYLTRQKAFWNVSTLDEARFDRVDTRTDRTEESWTALAERDIKLLFDGVEITAPATVLELGCGVGRLLVRTRARLPVDVKIIGFDISEGMIGYTREATRNLENIELHVTDGASLAPVADSSVSFVYSLHVLIHIADGAVLRAYLREIHRVLTPRGRFRFNIRHLDVWRDFGWSPGGIMARLALLSGWRRSGESRWDDDQPAEFCGLRWRPADLRRALHEAGFQVERLQRGPEADELWCEAVKR